MNYNKQWIIFKVYKFLYSRFLIFLTLTLIIGNSLYPQSNQEVENLKAFAKTYGYVKYFHPSKEASEIDWQKFSIYGSKEVIQCKNNKELVTTLNRIFKPFAPSINFQLKSDSKDFDINLITPSELSGYEPTFWQHRGVSFGMNPGYPAPYKSIRVNGLNELEVVRKFGRISMTLDATPYRNKTIKLQAYVKIVDEKDKNGHLRLAVYKKDGTADLSRAAITEEKWKKYEVTKEVDSAAANIVLGIGLKDKGALFMDNVKLFYKSESQWIEVPIENSSFEEADIAIDSESNKWWGESKGFDYKICEDDYKDGQKSAKIVFNTSKIRGQQLFNESLKFGEILEQELGNGITVKIPLVLYSNDTGTFPLTNSEILNHLSREIDLVSDAADQLEVRLGNVINTYNVFKHFYPYMDVVDVDWDIELENALRRSYNDNSPSGHQITLQKFTAPLRDGHITVSYNKFVGRYTPRITWEWIEDKLIITNVLDQKLPLEVGDQVTAIEGQDPKSHFEEIYTRISAGTKGWLDFRANYMAMMGDYGSTMTITVNGKSVEMERSDLQFNEGARSATYEKINENVYYLNITSIEMDDIDKLLPELQRAKSIICDLRGYPRGNHGFIQYLLKENDTNKAWMQIPKFLRPNGKPVGFEDANWLLEKKEPYLGDKQIIFLTNGRAISYAESYMGFIEGYNLATIIGQPTAGTNGNVNAFVLPGGFTIRWTGMKVVKHDGSQLHAIGFLPDIYVNKTIDGVKAGRDEIFVRALDLVKD